MNRRGLAAVLAALVVAAAGAAQAQSFAPFTVKDIRVEGLQRTELGMKRQYLSRGLYAVQIQTTVTPLERNRVGINIAVTEGDTAKIRGINLVGAKAFSEKELLSEFVLRTPGWLTWYTKADR